MALTAGELRKVLAEVDDDAAVLLSHEGTMHYAVGIRAVPSCTAVVIRSTKRPRRVRPFSISEDGIIGVLTARGLTDAMIGDLLDRSASVVGSRRRSIGLRKRTSRS